MKTCRLFVGVIALLTLLSSSLAQTQEDYFTNVRTFNLSKSNVSKSTRGDWTVVGTDSVPGIPGCRFILVSLFGITYLDGQGNVLVNRVADRRWTMSMSPDGSKIAYMEWPESGRPVTVRVESATGDVLWERSDGYGIGEEISAKIRVNNDGAVVIAPTLRTGSRAIGSVQPGTRNYPLLLDSSGELITELPVKTEAGLYYDSMSPDGQYYAINFCDIEADSTSWCWKDRGSMAYTGRNCVAVFDMRTGAELWRHYFEHCGHGRVVIGPGAETLVAGGQDKDQEYFGEGHSLYFFDRYGKVIKKHPMLCFVINHLTMSPSGKYVAGVMSGGLASNPRSERGQNVAVVFDTASGNLLYEYYENDAPKAQVYDLHVSDNAELLLSFHHLKSSQGQKMIKHTLLSANGAALWQRTEPIDRSGVGRRWLFPNGSAFVEIDQDMEMRVYFR